MKADLTIDPAVLRDASDQLTRAYLGAGKAAIAETTKLLERELEALTREAVPGRLWRAWGSSVFPKGAKIAKDPVGTVFVNGGERSRGAMAFWTNQGKIRGSRDQWLAIPTPAAGSRGRGRDLTPGEWEKANGVRLRFVYRGGRRSALLVADMGTTNARTGTFRKITRARTAADTRRGFLRGEQTVVIFVLVPTVAFGNSFSIQGPIGRAEARLGQEMGRRIAAL